MTTKKQRHYIRLGNSYLSDLFVDNLKKDGFNTHNLLSAYCWSVLLAAQDIADRINATVETYDVDDWDNTLLSTKTIEITPRQRDEYLSANGSHCPRCKGFDFDVSKLHVDSGSAWQDVKCTCGASWQDVYMLIGIKEYKAD